MMEAHRKLTIGIELIDEPGWMGGTLYLRNLAICLARLPRGERPIVRLIGLPNVVSRFLDEWGHLPIYKQSPNTLLARISRRLGLPTKAGTSIDVIYPGFGAQVIGAVTMRWIPDFQHKYLPHLFSTDEIRARDQSMAEIAKQRGVVVFSSEVAAADFRKFYPDFKVTPRVWPFCSLLDTTRQASNILLQKYSLPEKYLYLPNQFWTHKNHITVLKALVHLRNEYGILIPLVCTGAQSDRRNKAHFDGLLQFIEDQNLSSQVHFLGLIDREEQIDVLRHAAAVVQPSLFEGWSTVVEDVRATGRPIFLSDIPVHQEQRPERCIYFNPESDDQLAGHLARQWQDLCPGPEYDAEEKARHDMDVRILDSARLFCDISRTAVNQVET